MNSYDEACALWNEAAEGGIARVDYDTDKHDICIVCVEVQGIDDPFQGQGCTL